MITEADAAAGLATAYRVAKARWWQDGQRVSLEEYLDAALDALAACLTHYDATRGVPFAAYAQYRIAGAVLDAPQHYRAWRDLRATGSRQWRRPHAHLLRPHVPAPTAVLEVAAVLRALPPAGQQYTRARLTGVTQAEYGAQQGWGTGSYASHLERRWWGPFREAS